MKASEAGNNRLNAIRWAGLLWAFFVARERKLGSARCLYAVHPITVAQIVSFAAVRVWLLP